MAKRPETVDDKRRKPRQARAGATVAAILEAAAQILEQDGPGGLSTNRVAERAGVSVGSLYQYFADKNALLRELARREMAAGLAAVAAIVADDAPIAAAERTRRVVHVLLNAFGGRQRARKAVLQAAFALGFTDELLQPMQAAAAAMAMRLGGPPSPGFAGTPAQAFVLTRAVMGVIRAAVLEESPLLRSPELEDELVRLIDCYRGGTSQLR